METVTEDENTTLIIVLISVGSLIAILLTVVLILCIYRIRIMKAKGGPDKVIDVPLDQHEQSEQNEVKKDSTLISLMNLS